jgi:hypothetical protein
VPLAVFRKIGPGAVLLVETDPAIVHQRLAVRAVDAPSSETIARMGARERERATTIAGPPRRKRSPAGGGAPGPARRP